MVIVTVPVAVFFSSDAENDTVYNATVDVSRSDVTFN